MNPSETRSQAVRSTVEAIRNIEAAHGVTMKALTEIKSQLMGLATHADWFTEAEFPAPETQSKDTSHVYRLSQQASDNRFALYVQSARAPTDTPPHNHDTWAVITGIRGDELNRFYRRTDAGVEQTGSHVVQPGTGVTLLPDDLHSIHITDARPVINFHMYGLALEYLTDRVYYDRKHDAWKVFRSDSNIIDASYVIQ